MSDPIGTPDRWDKALKPAWQLERNAFGQLVLTTSDGLTHEGVVPVRAYPIQAPEEGISLLDSQGKEMVWLENLDQIPEMPKALIQDALGEREFMPVIERIVAVTSFSTPCTWTVQTDRGPTEFVLRGEEDIRRLDAQGALLVADAHGIQFFIRDRYTLDGASKRILDRFL